MPEPTQQPQSSQQPDAHHQQGVPQQPDLSQPDPPQNQNAPSPQLPQQPPQYPQGYNPYTQYPAQQFGAPQIPQQKVTKKLDVKVLFIVLTAVFACSTLILGICFIGANRRSTGLSQQVSALTKDKKKLQKKLSDITAEQNDDSFDLDDFNDYYGSADDDANTDGNSSGEGQEGKIGDALESAGIQMKLTKAADASTISYSDCDSDFCSKNNYAPKKPDKGTKYWVANVEITNNAKAPIYLTCGLPLKIVAVNTEDQHYTPIDDLFNVEGNPDCITSLQPGLSSKMSYVFAVPSNVTIAAVVFEGIDENYDEGAECYFIVKDGYTFLNK